MAPRTSSISTGSVRAWPRMSRDQLARLFPDGKTLHLPSTARRCPDMSWRRRRSLPATPAWLCRPRPEAAPVHRRIVRQSLRPQECRAGAGNGEAEHRDDGGLRRSGEHPGRRSGRSASAAAAARDSSLANALVPEPASDALDAIVSAPAPSVVPGPDAIIGYDAAAAVKSLFDPRPAFLDLGFSARSREQLSVTHFAGPAVKPLPTIEEARAEL